MISIKPLGKREELSSAVWREGEEKEIIKEGEKGSVALFLTEGRLLCGTEEESFCLEEGEAVCAERPEGRFWVKAVQESVFVSFGIFENRALESMILSHGFRVCRYACGMAKALGGKSDLTGLKKAALLHDIGKVQVPLSILEKKGRLSHGEFAVMKKHPLYTYEMLRPVFGEEVASAAARHHECLDGSGYPYGLRGEEICLDTRLIAAADVYDALTSIRSYRKPMEPEEAVRYLQSMPEKYDPKLTELLKTQVLSTQSPPQERKKVKILHRGLF